MTVAVLLDDFNIITPYLECWGTGAHCLELRVLAGRVEPHLTAPLRGVVAAARAHQIAIAHGGVGHGHDREERKELEGHGCYFGDGSTQSAVGVDKRPLFIPFCKVQDAWQRTHSMP